MKGLFRHLVVPVLLAFTAAAWSVQPQATPALRQLPCDYATLVLLGSVLVLSLAEVLIPLDRRWRARGSLGRDLLYLVVVGWVSSLLITLAQVVVRRLADGRSLEWWPGQWPLPARVALAFFVIELGSYVMHRLAHRAPWLWRFHRTHHLVVELTTLKAARTHPIDNLGFMLARTAPLVVLGAGPSEVTIALSLGVSLSLLAHANLDAVPGPLGLVVNFPRYHAVHHSADVQEGLSNFGCHTVIFDRLFGTFRSRAQQPLTIGVQPVGPRTLWQELIAPLLP